MILKFWARVTLGDAVRASRPSRSAGIGRAVAFVLSFAVLLCDAQLAPAQISQLGPMLVGTGHVGNAFQGFSVALSGDGNTAIVGGLNDNTGAGAAWVFTRNGSTWTQQGLKLVGTGGSTPTEQGFSVALSADGNTALVGGLRDVWVFTRSGGVWTQQRSNLVGTGAVGNRPAFEGRSVALSADGNTALVGGDSGAGATWVFTRSGGSWTQQGPKLVGAGASAPTGQGISVALSADGDTALVGGYGDNSGTGAAWVFTRSGGTWTQQGSKLVGTGNVGKGLQGRSVALSADGNTALIGGFGDNALTGAAWVFTPSGGTWTQQGPKLVGTGAAGRTQQGRAVALSADGNTAVVGGLRDAWVFTRSGGTWTQQGSTPVGTSPVVGAVKQGLSVALSASGRIAVVGAWTDNSEGGARVFAVPRPHNAMGK
jgi:hypothetical protein